MDNGNAVPSGPAPQNEKSLPANPPPGLALGEGVTIAPVFEKIGGGWFFVGHSPAMREVRALVELVAKTNVPLLILGESGTGKEVIVRLIHALSTRAESPFLKVNCAALPAELLESELFGYEAGAFTGAIKPKLGKFEACNKGTILLDEIAEMPPAPQAKLLHVLQDGEFFRLGSSTAVHVDVRVLAATNVNIANAIRSKKFREDLYYRLNAFTIQLPSLRERKEDIPFLLDHFMREFAARFSRGLLPISARILKACDRYPWPGNVRELENFVKRYIILGDEDRVLSQLEREVGGEPSFNDSPSHTSWANVPSLECGDLKSMVRSLRHGAERQAIVHALLSAHGSRKDVAQILKISLRALLYKMREYEIEWPKETTPGAVRPPRAS